METSSDVLEAVEKALLENGISVMRPRESAVLVGLTARILKDRCFSVFARPNKGRKGATLVFQDFHSFPEDDSKTREKILGLNSSRIPNPKQNQWFRCWLHWPRGGWINPVVVVDLTSEDLYGYRKCLSKIQIVLDFIRQNWPSANN